jgi:hypothetical protein
MGEAVLTAPAHLHQQHEAGQGQRPGKGQRQADGVSPRQPCSSGKAVGSKAQLLCA